MLKPIIERCNALDIYEKRCIGDTYCELVFYSKDTDAWNGVFTEIFGPAIKPAGTKATKNDLRLTRAYNGIDTNQTLFKKDFDGTTVIAMFWPWSDGTLTTLKITIVETY